VVEKKCSPPDLIVVEKAVRDELAGTHLSEQVQIAGTQRAIWALRVSLAHRNVEEVPQHRDVEELVNRVSSSMNIPGRVAGIMTDSERPWIIIGTCVEFGYTHETGYPHPNPFVPQGEPCPPEKPHPTENDEKSPESENEKGGEKPEP